MTSKIEVPRELLERVASDQIGMSAKKDREAAAFELRALLAAPEAPRQPDELDALWADAHYLCARVANGSLNATAIAERIRKSIDICRRAAPLSPDHSGAAPGWCCRSVTPCMT